MKTKDLIKRIKKAYPGIRYRYTYRHDSGELRLVFIGVNYEHMEFSTYGELLVYEE